MNLTPPFHPILMLTISNRFLYETGLFEPMYPLLEVAQSVCHSLPGSAAILADIHGCRASLDTETNDAHHAFSSFEQQFRYNQEALSSGLLQRPNVREALSYGGLGNGLQGLRRYAEAEEKYRKCIEVWQTCPGTPAIYLANMAYCFWSQGKLDEAEKTLESAIVDRNDTTSHRTGLALNCLGNIQISRAQILLANHKHEEAKAMFDEAYATHKQSLSIFTHTKGDFHHRTADSFHKLAFHLHRLHQYAEAEVFLRKALAIYEKGGVMYRNEIARTTYRLGCVLQDSGKIADGRKEVMAAEKLRQDILGKEWTPAQSERDFEDLVFFWSR
jgi:tetratricopeptide (TPR) repeat protein